MSGKMVGEIFDKFPWKDQTGLIVALVLAEAADHDGTSIRLGVTRIAKLARVCPRTVQNHIKHFLSQELLLISKLGGGRNRPNEYCLNLTWLAKQPSVLNYSTNYASPASIQIPCKNDAVADAPIAKENAQIPCIPVCTQPLPVITNPPTPSSCNSKPHSIGGDLENELWKAYLPSFMENGRDALIAAALKHNRNAEDLTAACKLAVAVPNVRDPVALAISKLKDKHWTRPPEKTTPPSTPKEETQKVTSKDDANRHLAKIYAIRKR